MVRIHEVVGSRSLECGCFVGIYETYHGSTVEIVEERGLHCLERTHDEGRVIREVRPDAHARDKHAA